jgi:hypothetical protein
LAWYIVQSRLVGPFESDIFCNILFLCATGVWDLAQIRMSLNRCFSPFWPNAAEPTVQTCTQSRGVNNYFDVKHVSFEHQFTIMSSLSGLSVAYLPAVVFAHTGENTSAYTLNNFSRPWDKLE